MGLWQKSKHRSNTHSSILLQTHNLAIERPVHLFNNLERILAAYPGVSEAAVLSVEAVVGVNPSRTPSPMASFCLWKRVGPLLVLKIGLVEGYTDMRLRGFPVRLCSLLSANP